MAPRNVYLVGSVPLPDSRSVFETAASAWGTLIKQIPDGETGPRSDWITHLEALFRDNPAFEPSGETFAVHAGSKARQRYRLKRGVDPKSVSFGKLGYAENAISSYGAFKELKRAGRVPSETRFQIDLVPAHSVLWLFLVESEQRSLDPVYNTSLTEELELILNELPEDISIQFDMASAVFARLERGEPTVYGATKAEMVNTFSAIVAALANKVPEKVPLLFHFCYGDANHKHAIEPTDMADMVAIANALHRDIRRKIDLLHFPVPRDRSDDKYFVPLKLLKSDPRTEIYLGLVHHTDGIDGTRKRIDAASRYLPHFGVATECGFGRRDPATIPELLKIHTQASEYRPN